MMLRQVVAILTLASLGQIAVAQEITYRQHVKPLWEAKCGSCHGADAPYYGDFREDKDRFVGEELGPRMDTYADLIFFVGWPDTGALMRRLDDGKLTDSGEPGNMYTYLGDDETERQKNLKLMKAWVGESAWKLKRWKSNGDKPGITKEELELLKVKY
jgi:hypothetical protein